MFYLALLGICGFAEHLICTSTSITLLPYPSGQDDREQHKVLVAVARSKEIEAFLLSSRSKPIYSGMFNIGRDPG